MLSLSCLLFTSLRPRLRMERGINRAARERGIISNVVRWSPSAHPLEMPPPAVPPREAQLSTIRWKATINIYTVQ